MLHRCASLDQLQAEINQKVVQAEAPLGQLQGQQMMKPDADQPSDGSAAQQPPGGQRHPELRVPWGLRPLRAPLQ